jgi:TrpR-related protein YerC/YecD
MLPNEDWTGDDHDALFDAFAALETRAEARAFLRDLCTRRELEEMTQRWAIARLLDTGLSYREIASMTGASTATVTRIADWLHHGTGGYGRALERLQPTHHDD